MHPISFALAAISLAGFATTGSPVPGKFAFGFDKLRWGMPQQDVRALLARAYPDGTVAHDGCRLRVTPGFDDGKLSSLSLLATGTGASKSCDDKIEKELTVQYGRPLRRIVGMANLPNAVHLDWKISNLHVIYNAWGLADPKDAPGAGLDGKVEVSFFSP